MSTRPAQGRALFYTRDSGGKHEMTPGQYVGWAQGKAVELGLSFTGTPALIEQMIRDRQHRSGDLFLDYGVSGNVLSRDGLNALSQEALKDHCVSHVLIPRRDRLARPDDPIDAVQLENLLRGNGLALVFMERMLAPHQKGKRGDIGELIVSIIDYEKSGKDRCELAEKTIYAQLQLARRGYSVGGRPPYGFRRWLFRDAGSGRQSRRPGPTARCSHCLHRSEQSARMGM
jgi:DNA invertase Pin-like site-specific DNA recombinase